MSAASQQSPETTASEVKLLQFVIQQMLNRIATVTLVKVLKVTNNGGISPVGTVDVQPLVNQMTADGQPVPHGTLFNIPYFRLQGGGNAIILDPQVGDIGMCGFCSRDISAVKTAKAVANPGSKRQFDYADGLYFGGFLNGAPTQYIAYSEDGIKIVSPVKVLIQAPEIELDGPVRMTSTINADGVVTIDASVEVTGDVVASGISLVTHTHGGVESGGSNTGPPT